MGEKPLCPTADVTLVLVLFHLPLFSPFYFSYSSAVSFSFHLFGCNCPQLRLCIPMDVQVLWEKRAFPFTVGCYILKSVFSLLVLSVFSYHPPDFYSICKGQNKPQDAQCTAMHCRQQDDVRPRNPNSNITLQIRRKIPKKQERQHTKVPAIGSLCMNNPKKRKRQCTKVPVIKSLQLC